MEKSFSKLSDKNNGHGVDGANGRHIESGSNARYDRIDDIDVARLQFEGFRYLVEEVDEDLDRRLMLVRPKAHRNLLNERREDGTYSGTTAVK